MIHLNCMEAEPACIPENGCEREQHRPGREQTRSQSTSPLGRESYPEHQHEMSTHTHMYIRTGEKLKNKQRSKPGICGLSDTKLVAVAPAYAIHGPGSLVRCWRKYREHIHKETQEANGNYTLSMRRSQVCGPIARMIPEGNMTTGTIRLEKHQSWYVFLSSTDWMEDLGDRSGIE